MLIAMTGRMQSGKDQSADFLIKHFNFTRFAFADQLKELAYLVGWSGQKDEVGRKLLQELGNGARDVIDPDVWVTALKTKILKTHSPIRDNMCIVDCRYNNEVDFVRSWGGTIIKIERPSIDRSGPEHKHITETNVDQLPYDYIVINDGSIEELNYKLENIIHIESNRRLLRASTS